MSNSVAMNDVVRVLGTELGKKEAGRVVIGSTEEEKEVLQKHAAIGKRRAVMGFAGGAAVGGGVWKSLGGQRRLLGGFTMASAGMVGFMYGMLSIRHDLFVDILTLPTDKSPFAERARAILDEQMPTNEFYLEVKEIFKKQQAANGSWDSTPSFPALKTPVDDTNDVGFRGFSASGSSSSSAPSTSPSTARLPHLPPVPKDEEPFTIAPVGSGTSDSDASTSSSTTSIQFFFGGAPPVETTSTALPPSLPYDAYGSPTSKPTKTRKPTTTTTKNNNNEDDDGYYSNDPWEEDDNTSGKTKPKPTTWEELRRRAAGGGKQ